MNKKATNIIWCLAPFFISFVLQFAGSFMAAFMWGGITIHNYSGSTISELYASFITDESISLLTELTSLFYSVIAVFVFTIWYRAVFYDKNGKHFNKTPFVTSASFPDVSIKKVKIIRAIFGTVFSVIGFTIVCNYIIILVSTVFPNWLEEFIELEEAAGLTEGASVITLIYVVILGPISEELIFRGCTFEYGRRGVGAVWAIIIQALLFSAMHMNKLQSTYTFVMGLVLGYIYYKTGNIIHTIIIHMIYNGIQMAEIEFPEVLNSPVAVFITLIVGFISIYLSMLLFKSSVKTEDKGV